MKRTQIEARRSDLLDSDFKLEHEPLAKQLAKDACVATAPAKHGKTQERHTSPSIAHSKTALGRHVANCSGAEPRAERHRRHSMGHP